MQKIIKRDMFHVSKRIKKANKKLVIIYNKKTSNYQVFIKNINTITLAYCIKGRLNANCVKKAYVTSPKFARKIIKNINKFNAQLMQEKEENLKQKSIETLNDYLLFASQKNCNLTF